ncbi:hypothetical protein M378DRAFT_15182 [Amanita muscaria Koide BX008]|uniref:Uncharacterized protein n=1 Tax=Amanita muscaria (strain Koide BX008) TaxID=946122 RepID=A0A0C2WC89_AMAMK|nr:hypothetical protein M378DRAFT_15182 [Amanita muscaria Koide BX008]
MAAFLVSPISSLSSATTSPSSSNTSSVPYILPTWSPRDDTVAGLYDVLLDERLVQARLLLVRGTPGCGKTTLMHLLHAYILKQFPSALVYTKHSWPGPTESDSLLRKRLRELDPGFPRRNGTTFLLFDEGQDLYDDDLLWSFFFKEVNGVYNRYRVVLFCSYGSPSSRPVPYRIGTRLVLRDAARISLWPREGSIGILLKRSEFDQIVSLYERYEHKLDLHPDLQDLIFDWTVGHVGAVVAMLRVISYQRVPDTRRGVQFTVEAFHAENPTHKLVQALAGGAFERGLPKVTELSAQPDVVALFRNLLKNGAIDINEYAADEAIRKCHRHGWIHADRTTNEAITRYAFPSPLHTMGLSWRLEPTNDMPHFSSLFDLAIAAISEFKPSQLHIPLHRDSPRSTDKPSKPQYQDEFYRSVFSFTFGNVCLSAEFTSAREARVAGCIDFFIPAVKWGIELTRDGNQLNEHSSRFTNSGAYEAWLNSGDMNDYILLDCCTSIPSKQFPDVQNLFHVVFRDGYKKVDVYDNMTKLVKGSIVLLENHH